MQTLAEIFGINLKKIRERKGYSQNEFAEVLDIGLRSYQRYENGERLPSEDSMETLAKIIGVNSYDFFQVFSPTKHAISKPTSIAEVRDYLNAVPDEIYDLAQRFDSKHVVWKSVRAVMRDAEKDLVDDSAKKKKKA